MGRLWVSRIFILSILFLVDYIDHEFGLFQ